MVGQHIDNVLAIVFKSGYTCEVAYTGPIAKHSPGHRSLWLRVNNKNIVTHAK